VRDDPRRSTRRDHRAEPKRRATSYPDWAVSYCASEHLEGRQPGGWRGSSRGPGFPALLPFVLALSTSGSTKPSRSARVLATGHFRGLIQSFSEESQGLGDLAQFSRFEHEGRQRLRVGNPLRLAPRSSAGRPSDAYLKRLTGLDGDRPTAHRGALGQRHARSKTALSCRHPDV
jgi:hypothetical protein